MASVPSPLNININPPNNGANSAEHTPTSSPVYAPRGFSHLLLRPQTQSPTEAASDSLANSWWGEPERRDSRPWHNPPAPRRQHTIPPDQEVAYERTKLAMIKAVSKMIDTSLDVAREALQIGVDTLTLVPVAGLDISGRVLLNIWLGVQSVETNRLSCLRLTERCANIYYSVREEVNIAGPEVAETLREPIEKLTESFRGIERFIHKQVSRPFFKRYLNRDEDARKIIACDASLTDSVSLFSVAIQVRMLKGIQDLGHTALVEQHPPPASSTPAAHGGTRDPHTPQGTNEIVAAIATIRAAQAARDSALDVADLYTSMRTALRRGDDMAMLEVLQVDRSEIQEAIKTLQRALEDPRLAPAGTRAYMRAGDGGPAQAASPPTTLSSARTWASVQDAGAVCDATSAWAAAVVAEAASRPAVSGADRPPPPPYAQYSAPATPLWPTTPGSGWPAATPAAWDSDQEAAFHREFLEGGLDALRRLSGVEGGDESLPPWTITRWEVDRENKIGIGFFSDVYKGTWRGHTVAIKILARSTPRDLFRREVSIWASMERHTHVLELLGASSATGDPPWFFVSPYMKNGNLPTFLRAKTVDRSSGRRACPGPLQMMQEIAIGMAHLHRQGPPNANNILIDDLLRCVISDFGQSELRSEVYRLSRTPRPPRGTLRWQAPELINGESRMTPEADVYAFAIVCVEILTNGEVPWQTLDDDAVQRLVLEHNKRPRIPFRPEVSFGLVALIERCWSRSQFARPIFASVASDLGQLVEGLRGRRIELSPQPRVEQLIREQEQKKMKSPDMAPVELPDVDMGMDAGGYVSLNGPVPGAIVPPQRVVTPSADKPDPSRKDSYWSSTQSSLEGDYQVWGGYESPAPREPQIAARRDERRYRLHLQHDHHPTLNLPLWQPCPVRIGAVGYLSKPHGSFITLFNALTPSLAIDPRVRSMASIHKIGTVREAQLSHVERRSFAQMGVEYVRGLLDFSSRGAAGDFSRAVKKRYAYPLRAGHKHAYLCTENTTYRYMVDIDAAKAWFKKNIQEILEYYGREHALHREDVFLSEFSPFTLISLRPPSSPFRFFLLLSRTKYPLLTTAVIGTLEAREYGLFVSHEHPDGQVHFNVYADRREGQDWGIFSTDLELSPSAQAGPEYEGDPPNLSSVHATKISTVRTWSDVEVDAVLLAKLRFKPDEEAPTRM
ncbi:hypothetical protein BU17DRAFT_80889 [Hysterangium stoloniferum]|nr:hypothetical protein BU17DRAFT_80889 [Hysterangium stoloniferum]